MTSTTRLFGIVLILLGLAAYMGTGRTSVTALIPAMFGAVFVVLALAARKESARKHVLHAALTLALIGLVGTLARAVPAIAAGQFGKPAVLAQVAMCALLAAYIVLGVQSFLTARRSRKA